MCAMKCLMDIIHARKFESLYENIIKIFEKSKNQLNMHYIPISYIMSNLNEPTDDIYEIIHILLEFDIIEKFEFERCPLCMHENKSSGFDEIIKCSNCGEFVIPEFTIERFKIRDWSLCFEKQVCK